MRGINKVLGIAVFALFGVLLGLAILRMKQPASQTTTRAIDRTATRLDYISPRLISNGADYPVLVRGTGLAAGSPVQCVIDDGPEGTHRFSIELEAIDDAHGRSVVMGAEALVHPQKSIAEARCGAAGEAQLWIVNDRDYPLPYALAVSDDMAFVASPTTDEVYVPGADTRYALGDGPRALATTRIGEAPYLVVGYELERKLDLIPIVEGKLLPDQRLRADAPPHVEDIEVGEGVIYVSSRFTDGVSEYRVEVVDDGVRLVTGDLTKVGVNPRPIAITEDGLIVGNQGSSDVTVTKAGTRLDLAPRPGIPIIGGHTEKHAAMVMGGKAPRDIVYSPRLKVAFSSNVGPNIGPNPDRMEVSMNGGITVVDPAAGEMRHHISMLRGIPEGLDLDDEAGVLYAADIATGRLVAFDAAAVASGRRPEQAILAELPFEAENPRMFLRSKDDFGVEGRNGLSLHTGPREVVLEGDRAYVLLRFTGEVAVVDVSRVKEGVLSLVERRRGVALNTQLQRRVGEIAYFTDLGNTRMTCDGCHYEGRDDGVLFTKGQPMHIYRSLNIRSARETAPYFTPAMFPSLTFTAEFVLGRNRFHNPDPGRKEVRALGLYQATLVQPPNPYLGRGDQVKLPDGSVGNVLAGMALFEGAGRCTDCHPGPQYTTDQDEATRARTYDVGTPITIALRDEWQDSGRYDLPAPSLSGLWDNFPLLHSGAGGFGVVEENRVLATHPFAAKRVLDLASQSGKHGATHELSETERSDLLAFLMTL